MKSGLQHALVWMLFAAGAMGTRPATSAAGSVDKRSFIGVNYGPSHQEGQSPLAAAELPAAQILRDLEIMFEMFDEPWKNELGGVGPQWGLFDRRGRAKLPLSAWGRGWP